MKLHLVLVAGALALLLSISCKKSGSSDALCRYLERADSVLELQDYYRITMDNRIRNLRLESEMAHNDEERYLVNRLLAECYRTYISDSALSVLNRNVQLAGRLNNERYMVETLLAGSYVLSAVGDFNRAQQTFDTLLRLNLTYEEKAQYYVLRIYYYNHLQDFFSRPYRFEIEQCCDSILMLKPDLDPGARLWAQFWKAYPDGLTPQLRDAMKAHLGTLDPADRRWYANFTWALHIVYQVEGDRDNAFNYLIETLINDVSHCNNDIPSLYTLCYWCYQAGNYTKAYQYIKYYMARQPIFPLRTQTYSIAGTMENLYELATSTAIKRVKVRQLIIFLSATTIVILLLVLVYFIHRRKRNLHRSRLMAQRNAELDQSLHQLHDVKEQLEQAYTDLQDRNARIKDMVAQLANANQVKEEHIAALFTQCSGYITKMDEQRKTVLRQLKAKKYEEATRRMGTSDVIVAEEVQELYKNFDALFLGIYPDFVHDLNTLLRPEEQIALRTPDALTNDLRIYALIRLGISSSAKIAEVLHLSPQTVYNARTRMRSRAICPPEEFPQRVRRLGSFQQDATATGPGSTRP